MNRQSASRYERPGRIVKPMDHFMRCRNSVSPIQTVLLPSAFAFRA